MKYWELPIYRNCYSCKEPKRNPYGMYCFDCTDARNRERLRLARLMRPLQYLAHKDMRLALNRGDLQPYDGKKCVDCGKMAQCYDHRNYRKPLMVEPVCNSCNSRRGPASPYKRMKPIEHCLPVRFGKYSKPNKHAMKMYAVATALKNVE